jgi:hypothetical protein
LYPWGFPNPCSSLTQDYRRLSTFVLTADDTRIIKSTNPVTLNDFVITPEQCGIRPPRYIQPVDARTIVYEEYATNMAIRDKKRRDAIEARNLKKCAAFGKSIDEKSSKKRKFFHDDDFETLTIDLDHDLELEDPTFTIRDFEALAHSSTSNPLPTRESTPSAALASASYFPIESDASQAEFLNSLANFKLPIQGENETLTPQEEMQE